MLLRNPGEKRGFLDFLLLFCFILLMDLVVEFRASHFLAPTLFALVIFEIGSHFMPRLA
jgi:hypothetical protein